MAVMYCKMCGDAETEKALRALDEQLRYTDPVSCTATEDLDADLMALAEEMELCLVEADLEAARQLIVRFSSILSLREDTCKRTKE